MEMKREVTRYTAPGELLIGRELPCCPLRAA